MPVDHRRFDPALGALFASGREPLGDVEWIDAHTHIGHNDPDGRSATAEEILDGLDAAGHRRALVFAMHEPGGYTAANDVVHAACAASGGRLEALARVNPNDPGALDEARRCLERGARGVKLHPRSDAFGLPHPEVERVVALAGDHRAIVLFHAGRGIPHLGEAVVDLARRHRSAFLVLAHAGISDLGWIAAPAAELPNLLFDTSWWQVSDLLQLFATIPPGQILYGSDMPYGPGVIGAFLFLRAAGAVGLRPEALRSIAGEQLARILGGEDPADLGPPPGPTAVGARIIEAERAMAYLSMAIQLALRRQDPSESLALARAACQTLRSDGAAQVLGVVARLCSMALEAASRRQDAPVVAIPPALAAMALAGTPGAGAPAVAV
jgi:predicted TIM-barrel fold metal-dependent hydrolase